HSRARYPAFPGNGASADHVGEGSGGDVREFGGRSAGGDRLAGKPRSGRPFDGSLCAAPLFGRARAAPAGTGWRITQPPRANKKAATGKPRRLFHFHRVEELHRSSQAWQRPTLPSLET